jgi:hypothetical protein
LGAFHEAVVEGGHQCRNIHENSTREFLEEGQLFD